MDDRQITMEFTDPEFCVLNTILQEAKKKMKVSSRDVIAFETLLEAFASISKQTQHNCFRRIHG